VVTLFAACFLGMLLEAWTGWITLAEVIFVMTCGLVTCYTRASGLRHVVVCPPLAFFVGTAAAALLTVPGTFLALETILVTLGTSALWLFTGTALTAAIAFGRGYRPRGPWPRRYRPLDTRPLDSQSPDTRLLGSRLLGSRLLGSRLLGSRLLGSRLLGYRPGDPAGRSSRGSANAMFSSTASTSSTEPKP
jgi:hypothetical protein